MWQQGKGNQPPTRKQRGSGRLLLPDRGPLRCSPLVGWVFNYRYLGHSFVRAVIWASLHNVLMQQRLASSHCRYIGTVRFAKWYVMSLYAAYKNLQSRQDTRNSAWQKDGWDSTVYYTGRGNRNQSNQSPIKIPLRLYVIFYFCDIY